MSLMIDTVLVLIPIHKTYTRATDYVYEIIGDVTDYDLKAASRYVSKQDDGTKIPFELYHMQESLPTSHTGIGFKFFHRANNYLPYVQLNCSIAKIVQGHNVYGSCNMITGILEMLGVFKETYPEFCKYLDFANAEISRFDITLPAQTQSLETAIRVREYLRNVDWGRYRNLCILNKDGCINTLYFGSRKSDVGGFKVYCKGVELVNNEIKPLKHKAKKGCLTSIHKLTHIFTDDVQDFASKSVRIEVIVKREMIKQFGLPTNLWQLLRHQLNNPDIYKTLFHHKTKDFFNAMQGITMPTDDIKVYEILLNKLTTITPTGKKSTTRASHAYNFYKRLKQDGFYEVKRTSNERTFQRNVKSLVDAGFKRFDLQNLAKNEETQILRLLNLDFNAPLPKSYKEPVSTYFDEFKQYLINVA